MHQSPYTDRGAITRSERFFGRKAELIQVFGGLAAEKPQCTAIRGDSRSGRSSLLYQIQRTYSHELSKPDHFRLAYLDCGGWQCTASPDAFRAEMLEQLLGERYDTVSPSRFDDILSVRTLSGEKCIFLFDNFEKIHQRSSRFDDDFFDGLLALTNDAHHSIAYVLASTISLAEIAAQRGYSSPFFGIFASVELGSFSLEDARSAVLRAHSPSLTEEDYRVVVGWVAENDGYHPLKLNIACDSIWQQRASGKNWLSHPDYVAAEERFRSEVRQAVGQETHRIKQRRKRWAQFLSFARLAAKPIGWLISKPAFWIAVLAMILLVLGLVSVNEIPDWFKVLAKWPTPTPQIPVTPAGALPSP